MYACSLQGKQCWLFSFPFGASAFAVDNFTSRLAYLCLWPSFVSVVDALGTFERSVTLPYVAKNVAKKAAHRRHCHRQKKKAGGFCCSDRQFCPHCPRRCVQVGAVLLFSLVWQPCCICHGAFVYQASWSRPPTALAWCLGRAIQGCGKEMNMRIIGSPTAWLPGRALFPNSKVALHQKERREKWRSKRGCLERVFSVSKDLAEIGTRSLLQDFKFRSTVFFQYHLCSASHFNADRSILKGTD